MSAANGAEDFYSVEDHGARFEGLELARERDRRAMEAWGEHPYIDVVDNRSDFETKVRIMPNFCRPHAMLIYNICIAISLKPIYFFDKIKLLL